MFKLTVAVTTYNRWVDCEKAVSQILNQSDINIVCVVVDDCSETLDSRFMNIITESQGISYVRHESNLGLSASRNTAIRVADSQFFSFCDDDDLWPIGLAARLVSAMESSPDDVGMAIALREEHKETCGDLFENYPRLTELIKAGLTPPVGSQVYRTELLRQVGGYRPKVLSGVDHDLWISLARIDPRVAVAWGEPAIVGSSPVRERLTTVEHRRRAEIEKSLAIWRDDLCEVFGEKFYKHFVESYRRYLDYSFFVKGIQKKEYLDAALRTVRSPWLAIELVRRRWDRIRGRSRCTLFPEFKGM